MGPKAAVWWLEGVQLLYRRLDSLRCNPIGLHRLRDLERDSPRALSKIQGWRAGRDRELQGGALSVMVEQVDTDYLRLVSVLFSLLEHFSQTF